MTRLGYGCGRHPVGLAGTHLLIPVFRTCRRRVKVHLAVQCRSEMNRPGMWLQAVDHSTRYWRER
jgi:hypothetical protein